MLEGCKVELIDITPNALEKIAKISRYSTNRQGKTFADKVERFKDAESFVRKNVINRGHYNIGRHAIVSFSIECSRACQNQLVRSAHLSYIVESQRYVSYNSEFIFPESIKENPEANVLYDRCLSEIYDNYMTLIREYDIPKEDARYLLPNACLTKMVVTGNLQAWRDFVNLRTSKSAQSEIRGIAKEILKQLLTSEVEVFFEDLKGKEN